MKEYAYAKINLALNVKSEREDGYHELEMIMAPINFYDELNIELSTEDSFNTNVPYLRFDEHNTIVKMINYVREKYNIDSKFSLDLIKHVPTRAGLAGGSADAATCLKILNRLCDLNLSEEEIKEACVAVGADVLFTYYNKPALVKGIGEELQFFEINCPFYILLVKPRKGVSTKLAFNKLDMNLCDHPDVEKVKEALENNEYYHLCESMANSLEQASFLIEPEIKDIKECLLADGFDASLMSGSGSTVFGITRNKSLWHSANTFYRNKGYFVRKCTLL